MPKFPTYHGELPQCLNPFKPHHWFLLLYWIFFRPTALKCYLYQADPDLYRTKMGKSIFRTWRVSAYHNLYVMIPVVSVLLSVLLSFPFTILTGWVESISIDWLWWAIGSAGGIVAGVVIGVPTVMIACVAFDVAAGVTVGVVFGVHTSIATSVWIGMTASMGGRVMTGMESASTIGLTAGILMGLLAGVAIGIAFSWAFSVKRGIVVGSISGVLVAGALIMMINVTTSIAPGVEFGVAFGLVGGVLMGILLGGTVGVGFYLVNDSVNGVWFSVVLSVVFGVMFDVATGLAVCIGVLRIVFYPFQVVLALCSVLSRRIRHPMEWDELTVLPLPYTRQMLTQRLQQDELEGLRFLAGVGRNPFRRPAMQAVLYRHLHTHLHPLHFLYNLLTGSELREYVSVPVSLREWEFDTSAFLLFLRELTLQREKTIRWNSAAFFYWLNWWSSYLLRERRRTFLTRFAGMLYDLRDGKVIEAEAFTLSSYSEIYNNLSAYSGGVEITQTFDVMATFLAYHNLSHLPNASEITSNLTFDDPIRPTVLTALNRLGQIGGEIAVYRDSSSRANRLAALARATDALKELNAYVQAEVMAPEWYLLRRIIGQWRDLITEPGGELGRMELVKPVENPYIYGNPVYGDLFVGREDILNRLEELWVGAGQKPSVVLYGHRRMGKSSILDNLGARFGAQTVIVDFNMQREGMVANTGELLYNLALAMYDAVLPTPNPSQEGNLHPPAPLKGGILAEPEEEQFTTHNPYTAFNRFLKQLDRVRGENRFIVTVDEFELIEKLIGEGKLEQGLLDYWRSLIQTYSWFVMALAGLHTLQEMTEDYWHPLFSSVIAVPISFLNPGAARRLITQPNPDFPIDYDADAIDTIIALTNGQPYLVQLICHGLVTRFNRQTFEEGVERERRFSLSDVEAVINTAEFYRDGNAYFTGVWIQAGTRKPSGQTTVLSALAKSENGMTIEELDRQAGLSLEEVGSALETLTKHDVVKQDNEHWRFTVELMRRWVAQRKNG
jgi:hypothetical protein